MRWSSALLVTWLSSLPALADEPVPEEADVPTREIAVAPGPEEPCAETFGSERPGATDGHGAIGEGCAIVETGIELETAASAETLAFPSLVRVGVHEVLELRAFTNVVRIEVPEQGDVDASAPSAGLGLKLTGVRAEDRRPGIGVILAASSVTNSQFVSQLTPFTKLLFDWELFEGFNWSVNAQLSAQPAPDPDVWRRGRFDKATVLSYALPEPGWLAIYADAFGGIDLHDGGEWQELAGAGLIFTPLPRLQLDAHAFAEVTGEDHPVTVGAGVSAGF